MTLSEAARMIKMSVSALDAAKALGLEPDRYGRCRCPIHGGQDRNMKLFGGTRGFYCFVCHSGGDVMDLVCSVNRCDTRTAVAWLNDAFRLGLENDSAEAREAARRAAERRKREQERKDRMLERDFRLWLDAQEVTKEIDQAVEQHRPKPGEPITDAFRTAVFAREDMREINAELSDLVMKKGKEDG